MKNNVFLEKIYRLKGRRIKLVLNMENSVPFEDISILFSPNSKIEGTNTTSLKSTFNKQEQGLEIIIPYKELRKIPNGNILGLMIHTENGPKYIEILNNLKKSFSVSFSGESYVITNKEEQIKVSRNPLETTAIEGEKILSFKGKRFEICGTVYKGINHKIKVKSFYLENEDTKEKKFIDDFTVDDSKGNFRISINLAEQPLYEGEWNLFSLLSEKDKEVIIQVSYCNGQTKLQGDYLEYDNSLYYYEIIENKKAQVTLHIKKNKQNFISWDIRKVDLKDNTLTVQGFLHYLMMSCKEDRIKNFIIMNRDTKEQIEVPIQLQTNGEFVAKIVLEQQKTFKENGIWDAFATIQISGINELIRLNMSNDQKAEEFSPVSKPIIISELGVIKNVRSYVTLHDNLAFQVTDQILICDISRVELDNGMTIIKGFMTNEFLNFIPKEIFLQNIKDNEQIRCVNEFTHRKDLFYFKAIIDWDSLDINKLDGCQYQFLITIIIEGREFQLELVSNFDDIPNKSRVMIYPPLFVNHHKGYPLQIRHFYNRKNALFVGIGNALNANCVELKKNGNEINFEVLSEIDQVSVSLDKVELVLKSRSTGNEIKLPTEKILSNNHYLFKINKPLIQKLKVTMGNYEVFFACYINNFMVMARVKGIDPKLAARHATFMSNAVNLNGEEFYTLLIDQKSGKLNFEIRELRANEKGGEKFKFFVAKGLAKLTRRFIKKPVWLIGENLGEIAQDNGFAFFQYCIENKNSETYYYVSKKDNKNLENLKPYKENILIYDSFKHYYRYWLCQFLIMSHGIRDVIPSIVHNKMNNNPKRIIYLQHGIIAMKKLKFNKDSYNGKIRKFVVSSVHEKNILIEKMNFKPKQIMVTGLSRFDTLIDKSETKQVKEILLMPTWREWIIDSEDEFVTSEFYQQYIGLLRDPNLHELLKRHNLILKFFPHIEIQRKYLNHFSSLNERIKVVNIEETTVKDLIQESSLLLTDYSSVVFDFNYLKKPVIFFQFDLYDYLKHRGSYVNLRTDLIGDIADTKQDLLNCITDYINNDFKYKSIYHIKSKKYYAYHDQNNSKRIYTEIKKIK